MSVLSKNSVSHSIGIKESPAKIKDTIRTPLIRPIKEPNKVLIARVKSQLSTNLSKSHENIFISSLIIKKISTPQRMSIKN